MNNENKKGRPKQKQDNTFKKRFISLVGDASHAEIADKIGTSRQNVGNWLNGGTNTKPDIYTLANIAKAYNVSTDYLLGLNEEKSADLNIQSMYRYTGLNEKTIEILHQFFEKEKSLCYMIDMLIQTGTLYNIVTNMGLLTLYSQLPKEEIDKSLDEVLSKHDIYDFDNNDLCSLYRYRAIESLISLLDSIDLRKKK